MERDGRPASRAAQHSLTSQVRTGIESAAPALVKGTSTHIDRLRVRLRRGASAAEISQSIAKAAQQASERNR